MIEADITDPAYTPPSSEDRDARDINEKVFTDDSFDSSSFVGGGLGSDAGSRKTHSVSEGSTTLCGMSVLTNESSQSYAQSYDNALWGLFDCENRQHGAVPATGNTPPPSRRSGFGGSSIQSSWTSCDCSVCREAARKDGWDVSTSSTISAIPPEWDEAAWNAGKEGRYWPRGSSPTRREHSKARRAEDDADRDVLRVRIADLEDRINEQAENMDYYLRAAQQDKAKEKSPASNEDRISGINPSDFDLVRACVAGWDLSPEERAKAMSTLNALQLGKTQVDTSTTSLAPKVVHEPATVNTGAGRIEAQLGIVSRDIIKLKAYEKFRRMQEDSDRLARIEAKLADNHIRDSGLDTSVSKDDMKGLNDLQARVTKLENIGNDDDQDSNSALLMLRLTDHFDKLERRVSSIEDDRNAGYREVSEDLSRLEKRFRKMRVLNAEQGREDYGHADKLQSGTDFDGWNCKAAAGRDSSAVGSATSGGYLREDKPASKMYDSRNIFGSTHGDSGWFTSSKNRNILDKESDVWGYPASDFGNGHDYSRIRRYSEWPDENVSHCGSRRDKSPMRSGRSEIVRDGWGREVRHSGRGLGARNTFWDSGSLGSGDQGYAGW